QLEPELAALTSHPVQFDHGEAEGVGAEGGAGGKDPDAPTPPLAVSFSAQAEQQLAPWLKAHPELRELVREVLAQDPRPAYKKGKPDDKVYGVRLFDVNVRFQIKEPQCQVITIEPA
ncbi:hypothetical protein VCX83_22045, partial [Aeromonas caviae]|nr:hypothetical protein [Aeromonas caviae]